MTKRQVVLGLIALSAAYAFGRVSAPETVRVEKEVVKVEVERKDKTTDQNKIVVEIKKPDGTVIKKTIVDTTKTEHTDRSTIEQQKETKLVESAKSRVNLSALAGIDVGDPAKGLTYGAIVSKPILGPIALGAWGLTNGLFGVSLGLQF